MTTSAFTKGSLLDASPCHKRSRCKWQRIWHVLAFDLNGRPLVPSAVTAALPIHAALPSIGTKGCSFSTAAPTGCWRSTRMGGSFVTAARLKD